MNESFANHGTASSHELEILSKVRFRNITGGSANTIRVATLGEGPLVLMVHGFPESWFSWRHQLPVIADAGYTAAALDVRGYGGSDKPEGIENYTLVELANDIAAVIQGFGADSAVLIGHDWGGPQVYAASLVHPTRVRAVVGLSAPWSSFVDRKPSTTWQTLYGDDFFYQIYFWTPGVAEAEIEADIGRFVRRFYYGLSSDSPENINPLWQPAPASTLLDAMPEPPGPLSWLSDHEISYYTRSFVEGGITAPLNRYRAVDLDVEQLRPYANDRIAQPSLFIAGAKDPARYMVPGAGDRYANPVPRMTDLRGRHVIDNVGHWIQQEAPEQVNSHIMSFLSAVS